MISRAEIENLANLSRLKLSEDEIVRFQSEMDAILAYVDKLKTATNVTSATNGKNGTKNKLVISPNKNVMREDKNPHESGIYTEKLLKSAPRHEGQYVKVKKIL